MRPPELFRSVPTLCGDSTAFRPRRRILAPRPSGLSASPWSFPWSLSAIGILLLIVAAAGTAGPAPAIAETPPGAPAWKHMTEAEAQAWGELGIDTPASHLLSQVERRRAGISTVLRVVVILIDFPDQAANRAVHTPEYFRELLFSRGTHPTGSVADYLYASSQGRLILEGEVRGWYTAPHEKLFYTAAIGGFSQVFPRNSQGLARDAFQLVDPDINFAHFDTDGPDEVPDSGDDDEIVDGIILVHAGEGREGGSYDPNDFVSAHWWTPSPVPMDGVFGRFFTINPESGNVGIFLHELGHLLGLPDLYPRRSGASFGLGFWSLMAGGLTLDGGVYPGDFDAWSKLKLGFANVDRVFLNRDRVAIVPTQDGGKIFQLWADGLGTNEYFLLENRQRRGLDRRLPGEGLLIYHVDERVNTNENPDRYLVALEQADGLFQLENRYGSPSPGDPGDPFVAGDAFGRTTIPGSLSNNGADTYVSVFDIQGPDAQGVMTANLRVQANALVDLLDLNLVELEGDGDGLVSAGELAGVVPRLEVNRLPAFELTLTMESLDPLGEVLDTRVEFGTVPVGQVVSPESPLRVRIGESVPGDPFGLPLRLSLDWKDDMGRVTTAELGIGRVVGAVEEFESIQNGWTHEAIRSSTLDFWNYGASYGVDRSGGFRCGYSTRGFPGGVDAVLVSPPILLPPDAELLFDHRVDIPSADTLFVRNGGAVEISINGGDWRPAVPDGGYSHRYFGTNDDWNGRDVFSRTLYNGEFHTERIDLSEFNGSVRVRFRFFSTVQTNKGTGWEIDNVRVRRSETPVRMLYHAATVRDRDVHLSWGLAEPLPSLVRWRRGSRLEDAVVVGEGWRNPLPEDRVVDLGGAASLPASYWLEGLERNGEISSWGPLRVEPRPQTAYLRVLRNPSAGPSPLSWNVSIPDRARLQVFDVRGRVVHERELAGDARAYVWEGVDDLGRAVAPGLYFARLRGVDVPPVRIVRLPR